MGHSVSGNQRRSDNRAGDIPDSLAGFVKHTKRCIASGGPGTYSAVYHGARENCAVRRFVHISFIAGFAILWAFVLWFIAAGG